MIDCHHEGYEINAEKYQRAAQEKSIDAKAEFCFSLYYGERFSYKKDGEYFRYS